MTRWDGKRELRYFTPWMKHRQTEEHLLPLEIRTITGQVSLPLFLNLTFYMLMEGSLLCRSWSLSETPSSRPSTPASASRCARSFSRPLRSSSPPLSPNHSSTK